jgi:1-hydroxycarotenoid 3,4-desaturase
MRMPRVTVIGGGAGGLAAAIDLSRAGVAVTLLERAPTVGGKIHQVQTGGPGGNGPGGGIAIDAGPTVLTMRWVFESLFDDAGSSLASHLTLHPVELLARHAWTDRETLDLFADIDRSADAIGAFAGATEAAGFRSFCARAERVYRTLEGPFIRSARPTALSLVRGSSVSEMWGISPFTTLWKALREHFDDPRLRQLFGRYATYSGSSPFQAPATLMLIAHVEQQGVWLVEGGMIRLAQVLSDLAVRQGAIVRVDAHVDEILIRGGRARGVMLANGETIESDAVVCNADFGALASGLFGPGVIGRASPPRPDGRSLSAMTWALSALTEGFPLTRHNVFFSRNYMAEFDSLFRHRRLPDEPTVYVCAQDRGESGVQPDGSPERLLLLVNAPPIGDRHAFSTKEIDACATHVFSLLQRCGLTVHRRTEATVVTTPANFETMFPATGGALYGQAVHGPMAAFRRPGARSAIANLYLAGGSVHPGPGVPMAVLSGRLAAASLLQDLAST